MLPKCTPKRIRIHPGANTEQIKLNNEEHEKLCDQLIIYSKQIELKQYTVAKKQSFENVKQMYAKWSPKVIRIS